MTPPAAADAPAAPHPRLLARIAVAGGFSALAALGRADGPSRTGRAGAGSPTRRSCAARPSAPMRTAACASRPPPRPEQVPARRLRASSWSSRRRSRSSRRWPTPSVRRRSPLGTGRSSRCRARAGRARGVHPVGAQEDLGGRDRRRPRSSPGPRRPDMPAQLTLVIDAVTKRFATVTALDASPSGPARRDLRLPRRQWGRQDDDHADRPRRAQARLRYGHLGRARDDRAASPNMGLPARGARPLRPYGGPRPARLLRDAVWRPPDRPGPTRYAGSTASESPYANPQAEELSKGNQQRSSSSRRSFMTPRCCSWTSRSPASIRSTSS